MVEFEKETVYFRKNEATNEFKMNCERLFL